MIINFLAYSRILIKKIEKQAISPKFETLYLILCFIYYIISYIILYFLQNSNFDF